MISNLPSNRKPGSIEQGDICPSICRTITKMSALNAPRSALGAKAWMVYRSPSPLPITYLSGALRRPNIPCIVGEHPDPEVTSHPGIVRRPGGKQNRKQELELRSSKAVRTPAQLHQRRSYSRRHAERVLAVPWSKTHRGVSGI